MASMVSSSTRVTSQLNRSDEEVLNRHTLPLMAQRVVVNNLLVDSDHHLSRFDDRDHIIPLLEIQTLGRGTSDG